ncbi:hypothetical protein GM50_15350 [freshwater metagenome]|uniref:Uncharacterized protein n=1 Tax=freshwater metagenome TaxID=449393 RepID=A0A094Q268_9ZZZZ
MRYFVKLPKFNESAAGAISIASRAELFPYYGRTVAEIPKLGRFTPKLAALLGIDILQKAKTDHIGEHARATVGEER